VIDLEGGFAVDHHDDAEFFAALGTERFGESGGAFDAYIVSFHAVEHAFDDPALAGFEIAEEQKSAGAFYIEDPACFHLFTKIGFHKIRSL